MTTWGPSREGQPTIKPPREIVFEREIRARYSNLTQPLLRRRGDFIDRCWRVRVEALLRLSMLLILFFARQLGQPTLKIKASPAKERLGEVFPVPILRRFEDGFPPPRE
jgi:hypothetical protein